jgi:Raf kinase inhibitor-like YbhB/YbcL family protein
MSLLRDIASAVGHALRPTRAGTHSLLAARLHVSDFPWISVSSGDFAPGGPIPPRCTADGDNMSPSLAWELMPSARELVIVCEDPDAPLAKPFVHWVVYRIRPSVSEIDAGLPATWAVEEGVGIKQGRNGRSRCAYDGPSPPLGHGLHHYHFQVFALREPLELAAPPDRDELALLLKGKIVGFGEIVGTYERVA